MPDAANIEVSVSGTDDENDSNDTGEDVMSAIDLPSNVAGAILKQGSEAHQQAMTDILANGANVHNLVRLSGFRKFDEIGVAESRANSGLMATPIASPTTQADE